MDRALRDSIPRFRAWSLEHYDPEVQAWTARLQIVPWAVMADFNGDAASDVVLDGTDGERSLRIALVSSPSSYRLLVLESRPLSEASMHHSIEFLVHQAPGLLDTLACGGEIYECHPEPFELRNEAFQVAWFEKASSLWYWTGDGFAAAATSD